MHVHGTKKKVAIKAGITVVDGGPTLNMSVVLPKGYNGNDAIVNTKDIAEFHEDQSDEADVTLWYQTQLEDCVRKCVRMATEEEPV